MDNNKIQDNRLRFEIKKMSEQLQENFIAFLDGLPSKLIDNICQTVVDYYKEN